MYEILNWTVVDEPRTCTYFFLADEENDSLPFIRHYYCSLVCIKQLQHDCGFQIKLGIQNNA